LKGPVNRVFDFWKSGKFSIVVSKELVNEYLRVLAYPKFGLSAEEIKILVEQELFPYTIPVKVKQIPKIIADDPSDDMFLACASAGKCHYLVSGDRHLLSLKQYKKIPIVGVQTFISDLEQAR
jgi:putative PIN family toxin of toxin-antitoxin system